MARPAKDATLTAEQIEQLAAVGCTDHEIALLAGVSEGTLKRSFDPQLKKGRANLRETLRTAQVRKALGVLVEKQTEDGPVVYQTPPDNTMLIWLGKQYLGQADKVEHKEDRPAVDWDAVPPEVRDAFIDGKISLDDVRRVLTKRR